MLRDYQPNQELTEFLAVRKAGISSDKNGKNYLSCTLGDSSMDIQAKMWDFEGQPPKEGTVIKVQGTTSTYQDQLQLTIQKWRPANEGEVDPSQFIPVCPWDRQEMYERLLYWVSEIEREGLKELVDRIVTLNEHRIIDCPAAVAHHHNYLGGWLEHTLGVVDYCMMMATPSHNKDLLLAGAILHDIGKLFEYDWSGASITVTSDGKLIGHMGLAIALLNRYVVDCATDITHETLALLYHMILSHHGKLEWGSPVEPKTQEAILLHTADALDAQMWKVRHAQAEVAEGEWTQKVYGLGREFYVAKGVGIDE